MKKNLKKWEREGGKLKNVRGKKLETFLGSTKVEILMEDMLKSRREKIGKSNFALKKFPVTPLTIDRNDSSWQWHQCDPTVAVHAFVYIAFICMHVHFRITDFVVVVVFVVVFLFVFDLTSSKMHIVITVNLKSHRIWSSHINS